MAKRSSSGWLLGIAVAFLAVLVVAILLYYSYPKAGHLSSVTITATGQATSAPTDAELTLYLNSTANTTALAVEELGATAYALNSTLGNYTHGNMSAVTTTGYNTYAIPPQYPITNASRNYTLYEASETVNVKLADFGMLEPLLSHVSKIGDVSVTYISAGVSSSKSSALQQEALTNALSNATAQAQIIIGSASVVYKNVTLDNYYMSPLVYSGASGSPATLISQHRLIFNGTVTVSRSVTVTFYYR